MLYGQMSIQSRQLKYESSGHGYNYIILGYYHVVIVVFVIIVIIDLEYRFPYKTTLC